MKNYKKTEHFEPIAMKCTQEQFEEIKPILEEFNCDLLDLTNFDECCFLTNYLGGVINQIENIQKEHSRMSDVSVVYHEWNAKTFLNACGIVEVEKTHEITETLLLELAKDDNVKEILKKEVPSLFESERYQKEVKNTKEIIIKIIVL